MIQKTLADALRLFCYCHLQVLGVIGETIGHFVGVEPLAGMSLSPEALGIGEP
jgi:hypothetical protein